MAMALDGIKVLDLSRLAPGPYCSMLLADFGADVTLVEAVPGVSAKLGSGPSSDPEAARRAAAYNALGRGKRSIALNLKNQGAREAFYDLVKNADVVLEGFRPGVVKRLGVDYETVSDINPRIVYCSLSGFGQTGPYSNLVGHDINYISIGGALGVIGRPGTAPAIPVNLLADFAGGGLMAAFAICAALLAREHTGRGQAVDMAMSDGVLSLMTSAMTGFFSTGQPLRPGEGFLTGARPWYDTYLCSDDRWFSIGSIEPHFYSALCEALEAPEFLGKQHDEAAWPEMRERFEAIFATKTADEWMAVMSTYDICAAPVLEQENIATDPHNIARDMIVTVDTQVGPVQQVGVGPKLSETPGRVLNGAPVNGEHTDEVLASIGYDSRRIEALRAEGAIG
tara:strand:+ start:10515 stop:11702 length:1188 start_codon:yes stop_codon:yes gene_type:complete